MVECIIGPPVTGENLFGRSAMLKQLWMLVKKSSVFIVSPRRYGKTSLTQEMRSNPQDGWQVVYLDVEALTTPEEFVIEIMNKLPQGILDRCRKIFDSFKETISEINVSQFKIKLQDELKKNWQAKGNNVFEKVDEVGKVIFVLDELPTMLQNLIDNNGVGEAKIFLQWLRQLRNNKNIRFIVCGSIGIDHILEQTESIQFVNDFKFVEVEPLTTTDARQLIVNLLNSYKIKHTEDQVSLIFDIIGSRVPYFIQLIVNAITNELGDDNILKDHIISKSYTERVLKLEGRKYFEYYLSRLKKIFHVGEKYTVVMQILQHISNNGNQNYASLFTIAQQYSKNIKESEFEEILHLLESEYYIQKIDGKTFGFYTKIMNDLWKDRYGGKTI